MASVDELLMDTSDEDINENDDENDLSKIDEEIEWKKEIEKREKMKKENDVMPSASLFPFPPERAKAVEKQKSKRGKNNGAKKRFKKKIK